MKLSVGSILSILPAVALAGYPDALEWTSCGSDLCATLEFCNEGSSYGYRRVGDTSACGSKPGPLIRMTPGTSYKLTVENTASDPNVKTNIHTHGLHISGSGDADDITRLAPGGSCLTYSWDIPSDHPGGTNWYHPHYHTLTNVQTSGGAFGMIVIDEPSPAQLEPWAGDTANELLLQVSNTGSLLGNGNSNEVIPMEADRWYRLRVSVVVPGARPANLGFGSGCKVYKVASDGVFHSASFTTYSGSSFELTGASRADFAIKCSSGDNSITWGRKQAATLQAGSFSLGTGQVSTGDDALDLGSAPTRPVSLGWSQAPCCSFAVSLSGAKINGASWDEFTPLDTIPYGSVHEWTISGSGAHPFHLHLYHMKIVSPGGCGAHEEGEFYDTISTSGSCIVQFYAIDIGQRMVMHCHVLSHEDNGAMHWMEVTGTPNPNLNDGAFCSAAPTGPVATPSPTSGPTSSPSAAPVVVPGPTQAPVVAPTPDSTCSSDTCSSNSDCCSSRCNARNGRCVGNRLLRASAK